MAVFEPSAEQVALPAAAAERGANDQHAEDQRHYTGVVLIHGIGNIKRNALLQQALNALSYWYNHEAGFALRSEGAGRLWITTELSDDANPDAPAARASLELSAPATAGSATSAAVAAAAARLEFREVWWAESFGLPNIGATIRWARVQAQEQAANLLIPIGRRLGPAHTAARTPARETPQALTYRPSGAGAGAVSTVPTTPDAPALKRPPLSTRLQRAALRGALWLYDLLQYVWKALQWLLLTPLVFLLLLVMGILQVLALLPFLQSAIISAFNTLTRYIMLHWIAEVQVYMLDYTRSSAIRQRFERELDGFLRDPHCERVVVIAHSGGTVIAYEGLTTALAQPDLPDAAKPVTFICLSAALRRLWLMANTDPHRVHGVLPERVRWLHFWARYDPVAAGPLSARSLPPLAGWDDPVQPNPYPAICASLERCENIDVVNTDSTFTDHTTYWDNLEQVVGPLARELVAGHPALEAVVQAHLPTEDAVLWRRWRVAWRATVALVAGFSLGLALLVWDGDQRWMRVGHTLATTFFPFVGDLMGAVGGGFAKLFGDLQSITNKITGQTGPSLSAPFTIPSAAADAIWSGVAALAVVGIGILVSGRVVALRSPFAFTRGIPASRGATRTILVLSVAVLVPLALASLIVSGHRAYDSNLIENPLPDWLLVAEIWLVYGALLCGAAALVLSIISAAQTRSKGWAATLLLLYGPYVFLVTNNLLGGRLVGGPYGASQAAFEYHAIVGATPLLGIPVGVVGCLLYLQGFARGRRRGEFVLLVLIELALIIYLIGYPLQAAVSVLGLSLLGPAHLIYWINFWTVAPARFVFEAGLFVPVLLYALSRGDAPLGRQRLTGNAGNRIVFLATIPLVLTNLVMFRLALFSATPVPTRGALDTILYVGFGGASVIGLLVATWALLRVVQQRRWGWLGTLVLVTLVLSFSLGALSLPPPETLVYFPGPVIIFSFPPATFHDFLLFSLVLTLSADVAALIYGLWGEGNRYSDQGAVSREG